jgi:hypothetical protein
MKRQPSQATKIRELEEHIKRLEEMLTSISDYLNRNNNERVVADAWWYALNTVSEGLKAKEAKP